MEAGGREEEKKKVSASTSGCCTRKVHVAVDGDRFRPWKPIGSPTLLTLVDLSSVRDHPAPPTGTAREIVARDNVQIEGSSIAIWQGGLHYQVVANEP